MDLLARLSSDGPKRILSLDGGGIRGAMGLGFLERIESILRTRTKREDFRLRDYFDLIGGTSTGAIIAACLAVGMEAAEIKDRYLTLGGKVFGKKKWKQWEARFDTRPFDAELGRIFGDRTLGDPTVTTGLCIVTKRADTRSTWPLMNHPQGRFFEENKHIRLRDAVRASTAAPVYFMPKQIDLGGSESGTFVDGGVSMANNPSLQLFLIATLQGFPYRWPLGEHKMLLVSVGSGSWHEVEDPARLAKAKVWDWIGRVPLMLIEDAGWQNQLLLQYLSRTATPWRIDAEVGNLEQDMLGPGPLLTYLRYDAELEEDWLREAGLEDLAPSAVALRNMSAAANRFDLARIGEVAAATQVEEAHFPPAFDVGGGA